jgi:hypothetical protein
MYTRNDGPDDRKWYNGQPQHGPREHTNPTVPGCACRGCLSDLIRACGWSWLRRRDHRQFGPGTTVLVTLTMTLTRPFLELLLVPGHALTE